MAAENVTGTISVSQPCYDAAIVREIVNRFDRICNQHIEESIFCSDEEKEQMRNRMKKIYQDVLFANTNLNHKEGSNISTCEENEAILKENQMEKELNEVVLPELDLLICNAAENRKILPPKIRQLTNQEIKHELNLVVKQEARPECEKLEVPVPENIQEETERARLGITEDCTGSSLKQCSKSIHETLAECGNLEQADKMFNKIGSTTDDIIFSQKIDQHRSSTTSNTLDSVKCDIFIQNAFVKSQST